MRVGITANQQAYDGTLCHSIRRTRVAANCWISGAKQITSIYFVLQCDNDNFPSTFNCLFTFIIYHNYLKCDLSLCQNGHVNCPQCPYGMTENIFGMKVCRGPYQYGVLGPPLGLEEWLTPIIHKLVARGQMVRTIQISGQWDPVFVSQLRSSELTQFALVPVTSY